MSNQVHQIPSPSAKWLRESRAGETSPRDLERACKEWMPKGAVPEGAVSHFAHRLMDRVTREAFSADELVRPYPLTAAPVNQSAKSQLLTVSSQPADGDIITITVGATVENWTMKTTAAVAGDIEIGADVDETTANIIAALDDSTLGVATAGAETDEVLFTASVAGGIGAFAITFTASPVTILLASPTAAVDATPGVLGAEWYDATHLYKVVAVTAGVPTWRKIAHSAL